MNGYVDFHSRVLPNADVENMEEELDRCVDILKILHKAKIKTVVATPYFNSVDSNVPKFLAEREEAMAKLNEKIKGMSLPRIIPGAEVLFTTSLLDIDTTKLCVGNTNYIMLSLPSCKTISTNLSVSGCLLFPVAVSRSCFFLSLASIGLSIVNLN